MTVRSMTGLGCAQCDAVSVEVRSLNHRHLDIRLQLPEGWKGQESALSKMIRQVATRGNVVMTIVAKVQSHAMIDPAELELRAAQWKSAADYLGRDDDAPLIWILAGASLRSVPVEVSTEILECVKQALFSWNEEREREGEALALHIRQLIDAMREHVQAIHDAEAQANRLYQQRLQQRIQELLGDSDFDEVRVLQEVAVMAERRDVAEERIRIAAHLDAIESAMDGSDAVGRKAGFIAQELLREVNTIGSKAQDLTMTQHVVALKVLIEQLREQVLNVE